MRRLVNYLIEKLEQFKIYLIDRDLRKRCGIKHDKWVDGYNRWKNNHND